MNAPDVRRLKAAVEGIVLDALWEFPMIIRERDCTTHLDEDVVKAWMKKVDELFERARLGHWKPEER